MARLREHLPHIALGLACMLLAACASPVQRADTLAAQAGFSGESIRGTAFWHSAYYKAGTVDSRSLHVYIENDGTPWVARYFVAADPTPYHPLMLQLMALDRAPALYLGRPCYFQFVQEPPCSPLLWTHQRYSDVVVASMAAALRTHLATHRYTRLVFFGHSGGGTLAYLLAERFPETVALVTLAGNLDVRAWADYHAYTPLSGSLDPALEPPLNRHVVQRYYVGSRDRNVPPDLLRRFIANRPGAKLVEIDGYDHGCCWETVWPKILGELTATLSSSARP